MRGFAYLHSLALAIRQALFRFPRATRLRVPLAAMALLSVTVGCGGGSTLPAADEDIVVASDPGVVAATSDLLAASAQPDAAFAAYMAETRRLFAEEPDIDLAVNRARRSTMQAIQTPADVQAFAAASLNGGEVFSMDLAVAPEASPEPSRRDAVLCPENDAGRSTVLYYVNGIMTPRDAAGRTAIHLINRVFLHDRNLIGEIDFRLFHNKSGLENAFINGLCSVLGGIAALPIPMPTTFQQMASIFREVRDACVALGGGAADLIESATQLAAQITGAPINFGEVARLRASIEQDVLSGKKVIVLAHSQGNFFAELAIDGLGSDSEGSLRESVGVVAVATPASYPNQGTYGAFQYYTVESDFITSVPFSPSANIRNAVSDQESWPSVAAHLIDDSYLRFPRSREPIMASISAMHNTLTNPRASAGQGFLQVTLTWNTPGDIDLRVDEPTGEEVYFGDKTGDVGELDRDDIPGTGPENYFVCSRLAMLPGNYDVYVNNFNGDTGTQATIRVRAGSLVRTFTVTMDAPNQGSTRIPVARISYANGVFSIN